MNKVSLFYTQCNNVLINKVFD